MSHSISVFAPATIANLGPGFDLLGMAVEGLGDVVTATLTTEPGVRILSIEGDGGRLPREASCNTAGIAAQMVLRLAGAIQSGVQLQIRKGLPLGSGLGSSAASAAAAAHAVNLLLGRPLDRDRLLEAGLEAEAAVSGRHADNIAPALFGGAVLIRSYTPLDLIRFEVRETLLLVLAIPAYELPTAEARRVLPRQVTLEHHIANSGNLAALIAGLCRADVALVGRAVEDVIVEPARAALIPGFAEVKQAALDAGALGCSISGAGQTLFAICDEADRAAQVARAMQMAFEQAGLTARTLVTHVDNRGARVLGKRPDA